MVLVRESIDDTNNPNVTTVQLANILCISETAVENNLKYLKDNGYIKRNGSNKTGYWEVIKPKLLMRRY